MWRHNRPTDVAVGYAADPVVMRNLDVAVGRRFTFGSRRRRLPPRRVDARRVRRGALAERATMTPRPAARRHQRARRRGDRDRVRPGRPRQPWPRRWPRSSTRRTASSRSASSPARAGTTTRRPPRRTPRSPRSAASTDVVLLAGGRNKGLDLASLADEHDRVKAVVALGEAAPIIRDAFARWCPVVEASSMQAAVAAAARVGSSRATPCCCRRRAPASTGTPRADTRRAATTSSGLVHAHFESGRTMSSSTTVIGDRRRQALERAAALRRHPTPAHGVEARRAADRRVLRDRRGRRRVRDARSGDGAVGLVDQPVPPGPVAVSHLQQAGDVGGPWAWSVCGSAMRVPYHFWRRLVLPALIVLVRDDAAALHPRRR